MDLIDSMAQMSVKRKDDPEESRSQGGFREGNRVSAYAIKGLAIVMGLGLLILAPFALTVNPDCSLVAAGVAIFAAVAAALSGGLVGFLFGVPQTLSEEVTGTAGGTATKDGGSHTKKSYYRPNSNLEQVSDWLTKIIVGVGLTQFDDIGRAFGNLSENLAAGMAGTATPPALALSSSILLLYGLCGFFFGYLWARLYLIHAMREADELKNENIVLKQKVEEKEEQFNEKVQETRRDAEALHLAERFLGSDEAEEGDGSPVGASEAVGIEQTELNRAIAQASLPMRTVIFSMARQQREQNWQTNKPMMERTIPVFRALIQADTQQEFHRTQAQLGFALKDRQGAPGWQSAEEALTRAIEIRDERGIRGWHLYEWVRSQCRIELQKKVPAGSPEYSEFEEGIKKDLKAAVHWKRLLDIVRGQDPPSEFRATAETILEWLGQPDRQAFLNELRKDPE